MQDLNLLKLEDFSSAFTNPPIFVWKKGVEPLTFPVCGNALPLSYFRVDSSAAYKKARLIAPTGYPEPQIKAHESGGSVS